MRMPTFPSLYRRAKADEIGVLVDLPDCRGRGVVS
jgi:hypothetical protein